MQLCVWVELSGDHLCTLHGTHTVCREEYYNRDRCLGAESIYSRTARVSARRNENSELTRWFARLSEMEEHQREELQGEVLETSRGPVKQLQKI